MNQYNVWMRSKPGFYAQYDGKVTVWADNDSEAIDAAFDKLKRTSFPDRGRNTWNIERVERICK